MAVQYTEELWNKRKCPLKFWLGSTTLRLLWVSIGILCEGNDVVLIWLSVSKLRQMTFLLVSQYRILNIIVINLLACRSSMGLCLHLDSDSLWSNEHLQLIGYAWPFTKYRCLIGIFAAMYTHMFPGYEGNKYYVSMHHRKGWKSFFTFTLCWVLCIFGFWKKNLHWLSVLAAHTQQPTSEACEKQ